MDGKIVVKYDSSLPYMEFESWARGATHVGCTMKINRDARIIVIEGTRHAMNRFIKLYAPDAVIQETH